MSGDFPRAAPATGARGANEVEGVGGVGVEVSARG
jgi:hypothetical protein